MTGAILGGADVAQAARMQMVRLAVPASLPIFNSVKT